ncbi:uncharacterized protein LOC125190755 isoform X2 [Salvia hispanica]|uniref:uncharacterized protein LOC125190755 isoform X2 n=1 Tax=Salvia hispanica TaxID=49212 RepID=UPI002009B76B|nr:uncharacterized protein LOC125190755 isoform X2 [Salvia hispanica]
MNQVVSGMSKVGRPRKKGRKRKNVSIQDEFSGVEVTVPLLPRAKRGRPRKNVLKQDESSDVEVTIPLLPRAKRGRPRKNVLKQDESSDVVVTLPLRPPAKLGRPRKNVLKQDESTDVEVTVPLRPPAKLGRPRKNVLKQDESSDVEVTLPLLPRAKRGRPRKNVLKQDESSDVVVTVPLCPRKNVLKQDESSDVVVTVPLRPRENVLKQDESSDVEVTVPLPPHAKLGRPRKNVFKQDESSGAEVTVPLLPRAKLGRPRKNVLKQDESSAVEVTVPKNIHRRGHARQSRSSNCTITTERGKLDSGRFLCYLMHIWDGLPEEKVESATYFDPLWFEMYANRDKRANVLSWIKEKDILSKKCVFVPIVKWSHWSLLIMYNLGQSLDSETNAPCLLLLDSLQSMDPKRLEPSIRRLLIDIYESEGRTESKKELQKIPLWIPEVPQQKEGNECGFYVLYYIRHFIDSPLQSFNVSKGNPNMMGKDWFTDDQVEYFCKELEALPSVTDPDPASYDSSDSIEVVTAASSVHTFLRK